MVLLGIKQFSDPYYQGFAAQLSFFIMLSLVPTLVVLSQLLGVMNISLSTIDQWVVEYVTPEMAEMIGQMLDYRPATTSNVIMIIMALWAASRAQFSLMRIANYTYTEGRTTGSWWRERLRAMKTMAITLFTVAFVAIILVHGKFVLQIIFGKIIEGSMMDPLWTYLRWPVAGLLYFLMVTYIYYTLPNEKLKFKEIMPGSLFGSVGMLLVTIVYSAYASQAVSYDIIYGSLASIVALMFWFYFLAWALCLGILFNKVWKDTGDEGDWNSYGEQTKKEKHQI